MKTAVIDYGAGNIQSVLFALGRLGYEGVLTSDVNELQKADKIIFPGVGEAGAAMRIVKEKKLDALIQQLKQPVLGICLGMQLLCDHSEESNTKCMGVFPAEVKKFISPANEKMKIPQVGWNSIRQLKGKLFEGIKENEQFYFVHSYFAELCANTSSVCDYIQPFSASLEKDNFYAVQFHPEKSGQAGEKLLKNFLEL